MTASVTQLCTYIKNIFEAEELLHDIRVYGEVSNMSVSGGNAFFVLKDEQASISCTCFGINHPARGLIPENGMRITARGRPSFYVKAGKLSFNVSRMERGDGQGEQHLRYARLKEQLEKEGLFSQAHKVPVPEYGMKIGVVTSQSGAALQDILNVSRRRNPNVDIEVFPVQVQGTEAPSQICRALKAADVRGLDVVILARGGGSFEDLHAFSEESVVRAVYAMRTPIITAVGHETDFSLADFAADLRAPTPSAAAELAVFSLPLAMERLTSAAARLRKGAALKLERAAERLHRCGRKLGSSASLRFSAAGARLSGAAGLVSRRAAETLDLKDSRLKLARTKLGAADPVRTLRAGYARVSAGGAPIGRVSLLKPGQAVEIGFYDGRASARIESAESRQSEVKDGI